MDLFISLLSGGLGAAIASGVIGLIQYKIQRADQRSDAQDVTRKALRYLMLYIIEERCKEHLTDGQVSLDDLRRLHHWHDLYHNGLGGNGDADQLMKKVEALRLDTEN